MVQLRRLFLIFFPHKLHIRNYKIIIKTCIVFSIIKLNFWLIFQDSLVLMCYFLILVRDIMHMFRGWGRQLLDLFAFAPYLAALPIAATSRQMSQADWSTLSSTIFRFHQSKTFWNLLCTRHNQSEGKACREVQTTSGSVGRTFRLCPGSSPLG